LMPSRCAISSEFQLLAGVGRTSDNSNAIKIGHDLAQELDPLAVKLNRHHANAGHVPTRSSKAIRDAGQHRVRAKYIHDGDNGADFLQHAGCCPLRCDQVYWNFRQFLCERRYAIDIAIGIARGNREIPTFNEALIGKPRAESFEKGTDVSRRSRRQPADICGFRLLPPAPPPATQPQIQAPR